MTVRYRLLTPASRGVQKLEADPAQTVRWIPPDPNNADWQDYQTWRAAGGQPLAADPTI
jgi:hypothetical protein